MVVGSADVHGVDVPGQLVICGDESLDLRGAGGSALVRVTRCACAHVNGFVIGHVAAALDWLVAPVASERAPHHGDLRQRGRRAAVDGTSAAPRTAFAPSPPIGLQSLKAPMLQDLLARMGRLVRGAALFALPVYLLLERRSRSRWPAVIGAPEPAGRGAYRTGELRSATPGRAPALTRIAAFLHLVVAGVCTWEAPKLYWWIATTAARATRLTQAMLVVVALLCVLSPLLVILARRLLRRDTGLLGLGGALYACAALGAGAILTAGMQRLPRETLASLEALWLAGAFDMLAVEACVIAFFVGARALRGE
jgi:hypothetical protein